MTPDTLVYVTDPDHPSGGYLAVVESIEGDRVTVRTGPTALQWVAIERVEVWGRVEWVEPAP